MYEINDGSSLEVYTVWICTPHDFCNLQVRDKIRSKILEMYTVYIATNCRAPCVNSRTCWEEGSIGSDPYKTVLVP